FGEQRLPRRLKAILGREQFALAAQSGAQRVGQFVERQHAAVIVRFVVELYVAAGVEIGGHAPAPHGAERLRRPGTARLAVATRLLPENPFDVAQALPLAALELGHAIVPAERR